MAAWIYGSRDMITRVTVSWRLDDVSLDDVTPSWHDVFMTWRFMTFHPGAQHFVTLNSFLSFCNACVSCDACNVCNDSVTHVTTLTEVRSCKRHASHWHKMDDIDQPLLIECCIDTTAIIFVQMFNRAFPNVRSRLTALIHIYIYVWTKLVKQ